MKAIAKYERSDTLLALRHPNCERGKQGVESLNFNHLESKLKLNSL